MTQKKRKKKYTPCFVFTPETINITEEALRLFEQPLQRADHHDAKAAFAEETINQVKDKLETMKKSVGLMCLLTFDYNEKIIIVTAIQLYTIDLMSLPLNAQRARVLQKCRQIAAYFAIDGTKLKRERPSN
jgi:hypothetical protein